VYIALLAVTIYVHAAASLSDAMRDIGAAFEQKIGAHVVFNFGASSMLERQIEEGAPADVFVSADEAKVDALTRQHLVRRRKDVLTNTLVVVVPRDSRAAMRDAKGLQQFGRIAIAEPEGVPAGVYAKAWLQSVGLWDALRPKLIPTENVRATLAAVEAGNADAGIVYRTDAQISPRVGVIWRVTGGPRIVYPAAELSGLPAARAFFDFLTSPVAKAIFAKYGFGTP
jgi:molybdate transport system substrate-binding protein